jgi:predicted esterase
MTREDRELAMADNLAYVAAVLTAVRASHPTSEQLVYVGFSQGAAMAYRAAAFGPPASGVIVLAGDVPPDVAPRAATLPPILIGRGTADDWYTEAKVAADRDVLDPAGVTVESYVFDGGHQWDSRFVSRASAWLDALGDGRSRKSAVS